MSAGPIYFSSPAQWRDWLAEHHADETEVVVGFYKKATGRQGMTWSESVDEALCFGWIDGIGRRVDDERNTIRFTPRKPRSHWSAVNIAKVEKLIAEDRMTPAGLEAFEARREDNSRTYSFEQGEVALPAEMEAKVRGNEAAWAYWQSRPPGYRRTATWWVISAKRPETRERRLATLIDDCEHERLIKPLRRSERT